MSQTNVLAAAQTLSMVLQQSGSMAPSPDPITAGVINTWLETHLPVSLLHFKGDFYFYTKAAVTIYDFNKSLTENPFYKS